VGALDVSGDPFHLSRRERIVSLAARYRIPARVSVIVTSSNLATEAAKAATPDIPIVFQVPTDPVAAGLVKSLHRPGVNLTGATNVNVELAPKRLELLHDLVANVTRIGFLINRRTNSAAIEGRSS
jgi:putative ABC transport system substrate-binding protein